ncbi:hypothetical protein BN14_07619 [Rhizoctonia solani AG-1 IB]|uniref:Uncharacterized protein n=1 Tax=Thanatephorus cucumeris (strain AG1-IB / isolate 7/3/14) TaxID=1108050 RepID=M5C295_THACB|nr:hypothetical protein BN14_07619 [Rhizoctonia solani AG-1 IB]
MSEAKAYFGTRGLLSRIEVGDDKKFVVDNLPTLTGVVGTYEGQTVGPSEFQVEEENSVFSIILRSGKFISTGHFEGPNLVTVPSSGSGAWE